MVLLYSPVNWEIPSIWLRWFISLMYAAVSAMFKPLELPTTSNASECCRIIFDLLLRITPLIPQANLPKPVASGTVVVSSTSLRVNLPFLSREYIDTVSLILT